MGTHEGRPEKPIWPLLLQPLLRIVLMPVLALVVLDELPLWITVPLTVFVVGQGLWDLRAWIRSAMDYRAWRRQNPDAPTSIGAHAK